MSKWEIIDLAPRDGTPVDLWVKHIYVRNNREPIEYRVADARWRKHALEEHAGWTVDGDTLDYVERDILGGAIVATHWTRATERP